MNDGCIVISDNVIFQTKMCDSVVCTGNPAWIVDHRGLSAVVTIWSASQILRVGVPPRARSTS
jgi:hypothetical protein